MSNNQLHHTEPVGREVVCEMAPAGGDFGARSAGVLSFPDVVVLRCANGSRPGVVPSYAVGRRRLEAGLEWPIPVQEVALPCTGRLQPEHLLKAFEAGADAVCVIACSQDNCHYLEGSRRAERRVEYVRALLDEVGLGGERLMFFHLPGSAQEDMALGLAPREGSPSTELSKEELGSRLAAIRESVTAALDALQPNPLREGKATAWPCGESRWDKANGSRGNTGRHIAVGATDPHG